MIQVYKVQKGLCEDCGKRAAVALSFRMGQMVLFCAPDFTKVVRQMSHFLPRPPARRKRCGCSGNLGPGVHAMDCFAMKQRRKNAKD